MRYGLSPDALVSQSEVVATRIERDNTGWVQLSGLQPNATCYYAIESGSVRRPAAELQGSFRTLPNREQFRNPEHNPKGLFNFKFEFACGNSQHADLALTTYRTMRERLPGRIHFAILNGDWIYEEERGLPVETWLRQAGLSPDDAPPIVKIAPTVVGVWENYKLYLERGGPLARWHREVPSFFTFDDHEILGDISGTGSGWTPEN